MLSLLPRGAQFGGGQGGRRAERTPLPALQGSWAFSVLSKPFLPPLPEDSPGVSGDPINGTPIPARA